MHYTKSERSSFVKCPIASSSHIDHFQSEHRSLKTTKPSDPGKERRKPFRMSGETKVADMASQLRERLPVNRNSVLRLYEWYHKTYIKTNSFQPVVHVMVGIGVLGYLIEYPHIKHELEEQKKHANEV